MGAMQEISQFRDKVCSHFTPDVARHIFIACGDRMAVRFKIGGAYGGTTINDLTDAEAERAAKNLELHFQALKLERKAVSTAPGYDSRNEERRGKLGGIKEG